MIASGASVEVVILVSDVYEIDQMKWCLANRFVFCTGCLIYLHLLEETVTLATATIVRAALLIAVTHSYLVPGSSQGSSG